MAKFKRLSRFLERIGIKKKQQKESVDLASRSRSSRRFWPRKSESGTRPGQPTRRTSIGSTRFGSRLFRLLKIKSSGKSSPTNVGGGDEDDAVVEDLNQYQDATESIDLVGSLPTLSISSINTVSADGNQLPIEVSCQWEPHSMRTSTSLTSVTELTDTDDVTSLTISITSVVNCDLKHLMETEGEGVKEGYENTQQLEDNNQSVELVEWIQPQLRCGLEEVVDHDEAEGEQSNSVDDMIMLFLPVIVTIVVTVCIYLLNSIAIC